jgi:predicted unusual protein kinase regulating ubiquinone biosynthesis (AarF/ABC1/UbiB family)
VIRSLLTQEGICLTLNRDFHFLEVAYPYVARRLLTDEDPALRERLLQVLFQDGTFRWERLANLVTLASEASGGGGSAAAASSSSSSSAVSSRPGLDLNDTIRDAARLLLTDQKLRRQVIAALTEGNRLRVDEVAALADVLRRQGGVDAQRLAADLLAELPNVGRQAVLGWADRVLA